MKKTYTPSLESISRQYGENYLTVTTCKRGTKATSASVYGTVEDIVNTADSIIFSAYGDTADLDRYSLRIISYAGRELVYIPCVGDGPDSARVVPQPAGDTYEVREIDAYLYDDSWTYNETWHLGTFTTTGDPARAFRRYLKTHHGVTFYKGRTVTEYDGDVYEIIDRKTAEPLFVAIPQEV
ncbi:MAG: hypothetical protein U0K60_03165 [Parafannyhessea umbonata]|nr:hypothetical protein [Parafannyhessea umbonata]